MFNVNKRGQFLRLNEFLKIEPGSVDFQHQQYVIEYFTKKLNWLFTHRLATATIYTRSMKKNMKNFQQKKKTFESFSSKNVAWRCKQKIKKIWKMNFNFQQEQKPFKNISMRHFIITRSTRRRERDMQTWDE